MRRLWILMAALMAFGALAVVAPGAGAASAPSPKFCAAVQKIGTGSSSTESPTAIAKYADQFKTAGKYAPKNVQSAANNIQKVLKTIKNYAKNPTDLGKYYTTSGFKTYEKSVVTFFTYSAGCDAVDTTTTTSG